MRKLVAAFPVLCLPALSAQEKASPAGVNETILEELRKLREQVASLEKKIDALDERLRRAERRPRGLPILSDRPKELADIQLPDEPKHDQVVEYVRAITRASRGQNVYSTTDPQVGMLLKIGRHNAIALVEAFDNPSQTLGFHALWALRQLAGEEHKDALVATLAEHPELAEVILQKKWTSDAEQVLKDGLKGRPRYLPTEWIQAVASLRDSTTYEDLIAYFIEGTNKLYTYDAIRSLPGIDLENAVVEAWERPRGNFPFIEERRTLAPIAIEYGIGAALETAFDLVGGEKWLADRARDAILRHTEAAGSDEEIKAFYEKNKGHFRWDKDRRKFVVEQP